MFENLGFQEITLIAIVFIVFFGPKKIPELMNGIGRGVREFRRAMNDVKSEISNIGILPYDDAAQHRAAHPYRDPAIRQSAPAIDAASENNSVIPSGEAGGTAFASSNELGELNAPLNRSGGNSETRYNWQLNAHNHAADWYFERDRKSTRLNSSH